MNEEEMKMLGQQLRCPSGEYAKEVGESMFKSNSNMIYQTIQTLKLQGNESILELGFGNGEHLPFLFEQAERLNYQGIDISEAMVTQASKNNSDLIENGKAFFDLVEVGSDLTLGEDRFDAFFTVNTLYFWKDPTKQFKQIHRVLKSGGKLAIAFIEKEFGQQLPFTQKGFTFYDKEEVKTLLVQAGFHRISLLDITEQTVAKDGRKVTRPFVIADGISE